MYTDFHNVLKNNKQVSSAHEIIESSICELQMLLMYIINKIEPKAFP